jgi:hypothetical protein
MRSFREDNRTFLKILIFIVILGVGAYSLYDKNTARVGETITSSTGDLIGKTYEQGLWDGHNLTIQMLKHKGLFNDTIRIRITEIDSVLHQIK